MKIIFATGNKNKVKEIIEILPDYEIVTMKESGINLDIDENGDTYEANSLIKARAVAEAARSMGECAIVMADDSGFEVDYLNKEPGVYSARYMGEDTSYDIKNAELIRRCQDAPADKRTCRFVCVVATVMPDGTEHTERATFEGTLAYEPAGTNGFGYDPILYLPEEGCTSAELSLEGKNARSHRGKALRQTADWLKK